MKPIFIRIFPRVFRSLLLAAVAAPAPVRAASVKAVTVQSEVEIVMRERSGNSSRIVKQTKKFSNGSKEYSLKNRSGTVSNVGRGYAGFGTSADNTTPGPAFHCQARGDNTQDSTAPSGHSGDSITTFSTIRLSETLSLQGPRIGAFVIGGVNYKIRVSVHGKVETSGDNTVASGRAEAHFNTQGGGMVNLSSEDPTSIFDGSFHSVDLNGTLSTFQQNFTFSMELLCVACVAKYKKCDIDADVFDTVRITGLTLTSSSGKRFEVPEIASASGIDYGPLLNVPQAEAGTDEFAFAFDVLAAGEADGTLLVRVNREHAGPGAASVTVRNVAPPTAGTDFEPFSTTLDFADGETRKFVLVKLLDDTAQQGTRTFDLELVNATGAPISTAHGTLRVSLCDDDIANSPNKPFGSYAARINPGGAVGQTGRFTFTANTNQSCTFGGVLRGGKFSGKSTLGAMDFIGGGKTVNVPGVGAVKLIVLVCESPDGTPGLIGTATFPDNSVELIRGVKLHAQLDATPPTGKRGDYTLLLDPATGAPGGAPLGSGFARVKVLPTGKVLITGKLADGSPLSAGGSITTLRQLPLLVPLKTKGELSGLLHFRPIPGVSDIDGALRWMRPPAIKPGLFSAGFTTALAATGARYRSPAAEEYILPGLTAAAESAVFHAASPDLAAALDREITIGPAPKNAATPPLPNVEKLAIKLVGTTGLWSGTFREAGKPVKFQGALLQLGGRGAGYFPGATQSGRVTLAPGTLPP